MTRKFLAATLLALSGSALLNACGTDGPVGSVRLVNATSTYASMDLYADSESVVTGVAARTASGYVKVDEGSSVLDVHAGGAGTTIASTTQSISEDRHYTLVAYVTGGAPTTQFLTDDEAAPNAGTAKLRVLNGASGEVGSVDVYLTSHACGALDVNDVAVGSAVTGLQTTYATFNAAAGAGDTYNVCVTATGSKTDVRLSIPGVTFVSGDIDTLILTPTSGGVLLDGLMLAQQGALTAYANSSARLRLVADAADGKQVVATAGSTALGTTLSPVVLSYKTVESGEVALTVKINGIDVAAGSRTLAAGGDYTLLVAGTSDAPLVNLIQDDNSPATAEDLSVKVKLVNGVNGLDGTASLTIDGNPVADSVAFGEASAYATVQPVSAEGSIQVTGASASKGIVPLYTTATGTLAAKHNYTMFVLGNFEPIDTQDRSALRQDH